MGKNRERKQEEDGANLGTPFADLVFDAPPPPEPQKPEPPRPPTREETMEAELGKADKALLEEFRKNCDISLTWSGAASGGKGPLLTLAMQRKGHGGKTVTNVTGLSGLEMQARMEICSDIKTALGIGARFVDSVLELQGDQRQRAAAWLEARGFRCRIP